MPPPAQVAAPEHHQHEGEDDKSEYEEIVHPNEEKEENENVYDPNAPFHWPTSSFVRWFLKFDEEKMKPFFIRKYSKAAAMIEDEY